ncbi:pkd2 [Symbiodinium sp. CCMP2456]|nr:pkd2 [Symbiodinium sp. CCMP2456]
MKGGGDKKDVKQGVMVPYDQSAVNDGTDEDTRSIETPNTKRERIKGDNLKLCGSITEFFLFLLTFSLAMFLNQSVATSRLSDHIRLKLNPTHHPITRITDVDTLYAYLEDVFVPALYKNSTDIQLAESISPHLKPIDIANRMLGTVRLRQVRVNLQENCQVLPLFEQYTVSCYPNYSPGTASTTAYGPQERFTFSEDTVGIPYTGALGSYSADGFMQLLASNMSQAMQQIQQLKVDGYLDAATRAFFAELNIWNSNIGLYAVVTFVVEFGASGGTAQEIMISTMTERVLTVGGLGTALDWLAFVLLILVMIFVVQFIFEEVQELYSSWRTYFFDAWNLLDWANMVLLLIGFTLRMLLFSDAANANVGLEQLSNVDSFQNISALASAATTVRVLNAFNCVLLWGKVTKYLRHLPLVKNLIRTVWTAFDLFLPFLIMFGVALVGFVMAFNVGFGDKVAELANFTTSAVYLCRAFLKDVQLMPVYAITPLFGAGLILLFYLNMIAVGVVCKALTATLDEESAWWHLCQRYWYATDDRLKEWPKLSARGLYRALEQWMPLEGFYVLAGAFPWGLIALLRIVEGSLCGYIVRFMPKDDGDFAEVQVPLFEVSIVEDRPGIIRSSLTASWLSGAANLAPVEVQDILAYTQESGIFFSRRLTEAALFTPRRALRLASEAPAHGQAPAKPATTVAGDGSGYAAHTVEMPLNPPSLPDGSEEDRDSDDDAGPAICSSASWRVGELDKSEESLLHRTQEMLRDMLGQFPCDLALIRSPDEFVPLDPSVPGLRPGLYVGDYGHRFYGQFRTEVLLLDYMHLTADELREEVQMPRRLFMRPHGEMPPAELAALAELDMPIDFMRGVKQCGDVHVPLGATTFVAVCSPPQAVAVLAAGVQPPARVLDRQTGQSVAVARSWRGFGTLAMPGFQHPSWAQGWLVQLQAAGTHRFGFVWDRNQDAVVLKWLVLQVGLALMFAMMADALFIAKYSKEREARNAERAYWNEDEPLEEVYRRVSGFIQRIMIRFFPMIYVRYRKMTERLSTPDDDAGSDTSSKGRRKQAALEDKNERGSAGGGKKSTDDDLHSSHSGFSHDSSEGPLKPGAEELKRAIEHMSGRILSELTLVGIEVKSELHDVTERIAQMQMAVEELAWRMEKVRSDQDQEMADPEDAM